MLTTLPWRVWIIFGLPGGAVSVRGLRPPSSTDSPDAPQSPHLQSSSCSSVATPTAITSSSSAMALFVLASRS